MNESYTFEIGPDLRAARKAIEEFAATTQKQLNSINMATTISAIKDGFELVGKAVGPAVELMKQGFELAISEALEAERSQFKLANALRLTGDAAGGQLEHLEQVAKTIQKYSTFSDDAAIAALGLGKQFQLTNKEAERTVKVAADLAAATDGDLQGAMQKLSQTFNGFVSRDLGKMIPGLKNLSTEALLSGAAIDKISERVKGTASLLANTFGGLLTSIGNNFRDLFESLGKAFTENAGIRESLKLIRDGLIQMNQYLEKNSQQIRDIVAQGFVLFINSIPLMVKAISALDRGFDTVIRSGEAFALLFTRLPTALLQAATGSSEYLDLLKKDLAEIRGTGSDTRNPLFEQLEAGASKLAAQVAKAAQNTTQLKDTMKAVGDSTTGFAARFGEVFDAQKISEFERRLGAIRDGIKSTVDNKLQEVLNSPLSGIVKFVVKGQEELDKMKRTIENQIAELVNNKDVPQYLKNQARLYADEIGQQLQRSFKTDVAVGFASGILSAVKKGAAGAAEAVGGIVGGIVDLYFPGLGKIVDQAIQFLSLGPDETRRMVREFREAVPKVVETIAETLPVLIEDIIKDTPRIINKIIEMLPRVMDAFAKGIPNVISSLVAAIPEIITSLVKALPSIIVNAAKNFLEFFYKGLPQIWKALIKGIIEGVPEIIKGFAEGLVDAAGDFVDAIFEAIKGVGNFFSGSGSGGGFISDVGNFFGDVIGGVGDFLGLASGGTLPDSPGLRGDKIPMYADGGETFISRDLTNRLGAFLDGQGGGGGSGGQREIVIKIGQQEMARVLLDLSRGGFRTA